MKTLFPLLIIGALFVAFYFTAIRPAKRRQEEARRVQTALEPGQEVMTTAGIYGIISEVTDEQVLLQVAPGVEIRYARAAIAQVITEDAADEAQPEDTTATAAVEADDDLAR